MSGNPPPSPQAAAASVPSKLILAGGASAFLSDKCKKVLAEEFDPPIKTGTHSEVRDQLEGAGSTRQAEHVVANSSLQLPPRKAGVNIPEIGGSSYSAGEAFTYDVFDGQKAGTEHKFITDAARKFEQRCVENGNLTPSLEQRVEATQQWTEEQLQEKLHRDTSGVKRDRFNPKKKRSAKAKAAIAKFAAQCIADATRKQFETMGVDKNAKTRIGMISKKTISKLKKAASTEGAI